MPDGKPEPRANRAEPRSDRGARHLSRFAGGQTLDSPASDAATSMTVAPSSATPPALALDDPRWSDLCILRRS